MNKKRLVLSVLLGALALPKSSLAAIDEAGMKYVSASEGLGGSIRLNFLSKFQGEVLRGGDIVPRDANEWETNYGASRLYLNGYMELHESWNATYYFEIRPDESGKAPSSPGRAGTGIGIAYQDVGLRGPFGWLRLGTVESVSSAMVPSADRTNDIGTSGSGLAEDYDNGIRWISPSIKGLQLGASFRMEDRIYRDALTRNSVQKVIDRDDYNDSTLDEWDVAVTYSLSELLELGFSYSRKNSDDTNDKDANGFKIGISHAQKNWGVSYNFHRYNAYNPFGISAKKFDREYDHSVGFQHYQEYNSSPEAVASASTFPNGVQNASRGDVASNVELIDIQRLVLDHNENTKYLEHVIGANMLFGRFNFAVNYSIATTENGVVDTSPEPGLQSLSYQIKSLRGDIGYALGSKSRIVAAAKTDSYDKEDFDENVYYLMYRVDF